MMNHHLLHRLLSLVLLSLFPDTFRNLLWIELDLLSIHKEVHVSTHSAEDDQAGTELSCSMVVSGDKFLIGLDDNLLEFKVVKPQDPEIIQDDVRNLVIPSAGDCDETSFMEV